MNKDFLDKIENTNNELERLKQRLKKIENKECTVIKDSVQRKQYKLSIHKT